MNKKYGYFKGTKIEYHNMEILEVIKNKTRFICDCPKCSGEKKLKEYAHVEEGRCFKCGGTGRLELTKVLYTEKEVNNKIEKYKNKQSNEFEQKILKANEQDKIDAGFKKRFCICCMRQYLQYKR
ncbi:MAG: hypothetical protein E7H33_09450 [Clostridium perfringens]|nr:hypothetical protein [Clostridium perfringens]